jgi:SAM-dependent methyltransferase
MKKILHIGCGPNKINGFINTDREELDILEPFPYKNNELDAIVSSHVLQELTWRQLKVTASEMLRVLKPDGVMRMCSPAIENGKELEWLLGWGNINLFSIDLLEKFFLKIGFYYVVECPIGITSSIHPEVVAVDNRPSESLIVEVFKSEQGIK